MSIAPISHVAGYTITEKVAETGMSTVYRAVHDDNGEPAIVKILKKDRMIDQGDQVLRFHFETQTLSRLQHEGIIRIIGNGELDGYHFIIEEDFVADSLEKMIADGRRFSADEATRIVALLADALSVIHARYIYHRDIKGGNVLYDETTGAVKLIDFGLAHVMNYGDRTAAHELVGTFSYMSPEQAGSIQNAPVDERSDLYSLGILFFELVAGRLPFQPEGDNPIESLMHQHVARAARPPSAFRPDCPAIVDTMILKLIEKEQSRRYQTALSLANDLRRFLHGEQSFPVGLSDEQMRPNYRTEIVGRDNELKVIAEAVQAIRRGSGAILRIDGDPGCGKSRIGEQVHLQCEENDILFVSGKFSDTQIKYPYGGVIEAVNRYIRRFREYDKDKRHEIRTTLRARFSDLGGILATLEPELHTVLGSAPEVARLSDDAKEIARFNHVVARFFVELAAIEGGLAVFFDDLQWADEGSRAIVTELVGSIESSRILLVGAYRSTGIDEDANHDALPGSVDTGEGTVYRRITLTPLSRAHTEQFVSQVLFDSGPVVGELAELLYRECNGNPFFTQEMIRSLVDGGAVFYREQHWHIDADRMSSAALPKNFLDAVLRRIENLESRDAELLSIAAVIGAKFPVGLVFELTRKRFSRDEVFMIVAGAKRHGFLDEDVHERGTLFFLHDRVREAFIERLPEDFRRKTHAAIGRELENLHRDDTDAVVFELAHHFIEAGLEEKTLQYAYPAGFKARDRYAYEDALGYFSIVGDIYRSRSMDAEYLAVAEVIGEVLIVLGRYREAIALFEAALDRQRDRYKRAVYRKHLSYAYYRSGDFPECERCARLGLSLIGERLPVTRFATLVSIVKELVVLTVSSVLPARWTYEKPRANSKRYRLINAYYAHLMIFYGVANVLSSIRTTLRIKHIAELKIGVSRELCMGWGGFASILMALPVFPLSEKYFAKSVTLAERLNDEWQKAWSIEYWGYENNWAGRYASAVERLSTSLGMFRQIGDHKELGMVLNALVQAFYYQAEYREMKARLDELIHLASESNDNYLLSAANIYLSQYYREMGMFDQAEQAAREAIRIGEENEIWFNACSARPDLARVYLSDEKIDAAIEVLREGIAMDDEHTGFGVLREFLRQYVVALYPTLAEAYLRKYRADPTMSRATVKRACRKAIKETKPWATHYGAALRAYAEYFGSIGREKRAEELFLTAIEHCTRIGRRYEAAVTRFAYSEFLRDHGREQEGMSVLESAYQEFLSIGAASYIRAAEALLQYEKKTEVSSAQRSLRLHQRMETILQATRDIASRLDVDDALAVSLARTMEATGAQRGCIFTVEGRRLRLRASQVADTALPLSYSSGIVKKVFTSRSTFLATNATTDDATAGYASVTEQELKSVLAVPVFVHEKAVGVCYLDNPLTTGVFNEEHVALVEGIMGSAAIAIDNAALYNKQRFMTESFQLYVPREQIDEVDRGKRPTLGGTAQDVVVGFEDIRNFTGISELIGAADTFGLINAYFTYSGKTISENGGRTNRYLGDARLMLFEPDSILAAVKGAHELHIRLRRFNAIRVRRIESGDWTYGGKEIVKTINTGIGMEIGTVMIGNVGDPTRMDFSVIGDPVNTASRLENLTKLYRTPIIISENVHEQIASEAESVGLLSRRIDQVRVRGKTKPFAIFELFSCLDKRTVESRIATADRFDEALSLYLMTGSPELVRKNRRAAVALFTEILAKHNDDVARVLHRRIVDLLHANTAEWDGVYTQLES